MREFQVIGHIQRQASALDTPDSGVKLGIGDDAAVLDVASDQHLVVATDTLNVGVHFPVTTAAYDIGHKCLAVNLSDIAAMGANPRWVLLSLSLPAVDPDWVEAFTAGFVSLAKLHGVSLVGGDTTSGPLSISVTAMGVVAHDMQLTRRGALPGDLVVVSGNIGGASRALEMLQSEEAVSEQHLLDCPQPRVGLGQVLVGHASACIDISDGLLADIGHVLAASVCGARIELANLPASQNLSNLDQESRWKHQLSGGDDYELLFTLPREKQEMLAVWRKQLDIDLSIIGEIEAGQGARCVRPDGTVYQSQFSGFEHFGPKS